MPAKRLPMRKIKDALRLRWGLGLTSRQAAASLGLARSIVAEYVRRAEEAGLSWPLPEDCDDFILERRLFPAPLLIAAADRPLPDWNEVARELPRKGVTLFLLWHEYKEAHPLGYQYSRFCDLHREWAGRRSVWMRQDHKAGERMFVDYAGGTVLVVDRETGDVRQAQIFVAVLGASNYTFAEATWTQGLEDWVGAHVRAFEYFGGVAALVVPDNLWSGVSRACRYEPGINSTYAEMLAHYSSAALPTRVGRPRDKAKVESAVQVTQRWILARLRNRTFFSLAEINSAIRTLLEDLNTRPFRKLPGSRRSQYETLDRPALQLLPAERYELAEWRKVRVALDYHVEVGGHYYSVPYQLCGLELEARLTARVVECLHKGRRARGRAKDDRSPQYPRRCLLRRGALMLAHPTLDKLYALRLGGMARAWEEQMRMMDLRELSFEERFGLLVDREMTERCDLKLRIRLKMARLRLSACVKDIDYRQPRGRVDEAFQPDPRDHRMDDQEVDGDGGEADDGRE